MKDNIEKRIEQIRDEIIQEYNIKDGDSFTTYELLDIYFDDIKKNMEII